MFSSAENNQLEHPSFLARSPPGSSQNNSRTLSPPPDTPPPDANMVKHGSKLGRDIQIDQTSDDDVGFTTPRRYAKAKKTSDDLISAPVGLFNNFSVLYNDLPTANVPSEPNFEEKVPRIFIKITASEANINKINTEINADTYPNSRKFL